VNRMSEKGEPDGYKCMMSVLGRHLLREWFYIRRSYTRAEHSPTWVKKSPISRNSQKKKLGMAFKTDSDIDKALNMNKVDLQRTK